MKRFVIRWWMIFSVLLFISPMYGCGGSEYSLSLTVSGLSGSLSITLNKNGTSGDTLTVTADGTQTFTTKLTSTDYYSFTMTAPSGQTCVVQNATGYISSDTTLQTLCAATDSLSTVTGSVNGLASGETIYLGLNNGQTQTLASGDFSFDSLPTGYQYQFNLLIGGPGKHCTLSNSSGTVSGNVSTMISCQTVNILFANGSIFNGDLGGRSGADQKCSLIAAFMGPHITCDVNKAFLSTSSHDQLADFPSLYSFNANLPLYTYDSSSGQGEAFFQSNWEGLFQYYGDGTTPNAFSSLVWTGTNQDGTVSFDNCNGFNAPRPFTLGVAMSTASSIDDGLFYCFAPYELACTCGQEDYQVGGTVSGLSDGNNVIVRLTYNGSSTEDVTVIGSGPFFFGYAFSAGDSYSASIVSTTAEGACSFDGASSGTVGASSADALSITCSEEVLAKQIFVTDATYTGGDVGGISGADSKCMSQASTLGYSGTYKALLGSSTRSTSSDWVLAASTEYVRASDGTTVIGSTNSSATFDFPLTNSWNDASSNSWTGLTSSWAVSSDTCTNWSMNDGVYGNYGINNAIDNTAIADISNHYCLTATYHLICVEQ